MILTLASASPRRRELLEAAGVAFRVQPNDVDETPFPGEDPVRYALRVARDKCLGEEPVLAADTVVHLEGRIYGKPSSVADAERMLGELAGQEHLVTTATCLRFGREVARATTTRVRFRALRPEEIRAYVATGEPMDKAGSYGIQGRGGALVERVEGSTTNVIGLPLAEVLEDLRSLGVIP